MAEIPQPKPVHPFAQHAPWLLAIGGLVVALVHVRAEPPPAAPTQPAIVQLTADADGFGIELPHVLVDGVASIDVVPDVVDVTVVLAIEKTSASEAVAVMREQQAELVEALAAEGVTGTNLRVSQLRVSPVYDSDFAGRSRIRGYEASVTAVATTCEFDAIGDLLERAAAFEIGHVSTQFRSTALQTKKRELRDMALQAARDKAEQSAAALGVELGAVLSIEEPAQNNFGGWGVGNVFSNEYVSMPTGASESLVPGAVSLSLTIAVEYAIAGPVRS